MLFTFIPAFHIREAARVLSEGTVADLFFRKQRAVAKHPFPSGWRVGLVVAFMLLLMADRAISARHPVPEDYASSARVPDLPQARIIVDPGSTNIQRDLAAALKGAAQGDGIAQPVKMLALSGGGENGAYGAGLLCGWTKTGNRPQFDLVTGVSSGSLIAPLAFLGPEYDRQLRYCYSEIHPNQVFLKRSVFGILKHRDSVADSKPLQNLIEGMLGDKELLEIAREQRKGRRLLVMTTNLDAQKPVIWDIGAIAASGHPAALQLTRKILLASSSIPVIFPPVLFEVEANGHHYDELHVDGAVMAQVFGGGLFLANESHRPMDFYLIRNGRTGPEYEATQRKLSAIAGRSIGTMMKVQAQSDILRAWISARLAGTNFHYISIPDDFQMQLEEPFDPKYMKGLFQRGYRQALGGIPWQRTPTGLQGIKWPDAVTN